MNKLTIQDFHWITDDILKRKKILVIGDSVLDIWRSVSAKGKSPEGPHFKTDAEYYKYSLGGCWNIARLLLESNSEVTLATDLGSPKCFTLRDGKYDYVKRSANSLKKNKRAKIVDKKSYMSVKERVVCENEVIVRIDDDVHSLSSSEPFNKKIKMLLESDEFDTVIVQDYGKGLINKEIVKIIENNKSHIYNLIYCPHITTPRDCLIKGADIIKINRKEFENLTGDKYEGSKKLIEDLGIQKGLIVTGVDGVMLYSRNGYTVNGHGSFYISKPNVCGAGDVVTAMIAKFDRFCWMEKYAGEQRKFLWAIGKMATEKCLYPDVIPTIGELMEDLWDYHVDKDSLSNWKWGCGSVDINFLKNFKMKCDIMSTSIILINGCFDGLHPGHFELFRKANEMKNTGGKFALVVALNSDNYIRNKNGKFRFDAVERISQIGQIKGANLITIFGSEKELERICKYLHPNIMIKGSEYENEPITGKQYCDCIMFVKMHKNYHSNALYK